jgi:hypothetical protein
MVSIGLVIPSTRFTSVEPTLDMQSYVSMYRSKLCIKVHAKKRALHFRTEGVLVMPKLE